MLRMIAATALTATLLLNAGCGRDGSSPAGGTSSLAPAPSLGGGLPTGLLVETIEGASVGPRQARAGAKEGDPVLLVGHIAGRAAPFVEGRAMFTLADLDLPACTDGCAAPWDLCCESPEAVATGSATVQVTGPDGRVLRLPLDGDGPLRPGQHVIVDGIVEQLDDHVFVVTARRIAGGSAKTASE